MLIIINHLLIDYLKLSAYKFIKMPLIYIQFLLFFTIATLQAITGLGGGTLYIAALTLTDVNYMHIPVIALLSNVVSASTASYNYYRQSSLSFQLIKPFLITAIPAAYIGGKLQLPEKTFSFLMLSVMIMVAVKMLFVHTKKAKVDTTPHILLMLSLGAVAGLLSGIVGIGGAIFLVPIMYYYNLADPKVITSSAVLFVLINSSFGLIGHAVKLNDFSFLSVYIPLFIASFLGGKFGSFLTIKTIPSEKIQYITTGVILAVALKIFLSLF